MDGYNYKKPDGVSSSSSSSSSFTSDLFGFKEPPPSSSTGMFASIFDHPSTHLARKPPVPEVRGSWQKHQPGSPNWNTKQAAHSEDESYNMHYNNRNTMFQEERVAPCHLSSSIYYGGQDNYSHSSTTQAPGSYPTFKQDVAEDDPNGQGSNGASRGNWWQGSLYY